MTTGTEHISVGAYWQDRKYTARQFIEACHRFLSELKGISPLFSNRCITTERQLVPISDDLPSFSQAMSRSLADPDYVYTNPDKSVRSFTMDSTLPQGFVAAFSDCDINATEESAISIFVRAGAHGHANATGSAFFTLPPRDALMNDSAQRTAILNLMIRVWSPEFATITSKELLKVLDPERKNSRPFGAMMYFDDPHVEALVSNTPHVVLVQPQGAAGTIIVINAPLPWAKSADMFKPCFEKLSRAGRRGFLAPKHG